MWSIIAVRALILTAHRWPRTGSKLGREAIVVFVRIWSAKKDQLYEKNMFKGTTRSGNATEIDSDVRRNARRATGPRLISEIVEPRFRGLYSDLI